MRAKLADAIEAVRTRQTLVLASAGAAFEAADQTAAGSVAEALALLAELKAALRLEEDDNLRGRLYELQAQLEAVSVIAAKMQKEQDRFVESVRQIERIQRTIRADLTILGEEGLHTEDIQDLIEDRRHLHEARTGTDDVRL